MLIPRGGSRQSAGETSGEELGRGKKKSLMKREPRPFAFSPNNNRVVVGGGGTVNEILTKWCSRDTTQKKTGWGV